MISKQELIKYSIQIFLEISGAFIAIWLGYVSLKRPIARRINKNSKETLVRSAKSELLFNFVKNLRILIFFEQQIQKDVGSRKFTYLRYSTRMIKDFVYHINWKQDAAQLRMLNLIGIMEDENRALSDRSIDNNQWIQNRIENSKKIKTEVEDLILKWINLIIKQHRLDIKLVEESLLKNTEEELRKDALSQA